MPQICKYRNCHNLGSRIYEGYCSESHKEKGDQDDIISARMLAEYEARKAKVEAEKAKKDTS